MLSSRPLLNKHRQLPGTGDGFEQCVDELRVLGDVLTQPVGAVWLVHGPDDLWVVAVGGLVGAGVEVVLVGVALGDQAGGVLGAQVDLDQLVVLSSSVRAGGDGFQIGFEPARPATQAGPGVQAVGFSAQP